MAGMLTLSQLIRLLVDGDLSTLFGKPHQFSFLIDTKHLFTLVLPIVPVTHSLMLMQL